MHVSTPQKDLAGLGAVRRTNGSGWPALLIPLAAAATVLAADAPKVEQVIVVFKTHFDIGYTDMASNVVQRYRTTMIEQALQVCDLNRELPPEQQFTWTLPGWPMAKIAGDWPGQSPERKDRINRALKEGRFAVHALPFTTHTELLGCEDLVRALGFASQLARQNGLRLPRDAKMTDVPCHTWFVPTLLKHAGVDFLHLGCNAACRSPAVPVLFRWQGPDGSLLMTMYTAESYGTGLAPPKDWPYKTWLALIHTGDNHGPPTPEEVRQLLKQAAAQLPGVKVRIGRLSDFAEAIQAEKAHLPIVRGDMPDTWIHGPMCDPAGARLARNVRPAIAQLEALNTLLGAWAGGAGENKHGPPPPPAGGDGGEVARAIAAAYESSLLYGEHTWGGALYWLKDQLTHGGDWRNRRQRGDFNRLEASWAEHTAYIERAGDLTRPLLDLHLQALAEAVDVFGGRIVVFNPLPWQRDGLVTLKVFDPGVRALRAVDTGERVLTEIDDGTFRFVARDLPPLGYRTYVPVEPRGTAPSPLRADGEASLIESPFFRARLDPGRGTIVSLVDKKSGRELVEAGAPWGLGQYLYERFDFDNVVRFVKAYIKISAAWATNELGKPNLPPAAQAPYRAASPRGFDLRFERSEVSVAAVLKAEPAEAVKHPVSLKVTLYRALPYVDLELTLAGKPADSWPEAGWLCLPFRVEEPQFRLGRLGSIVDPSTDIVPGSNFHLFGLDTGVTITEPDGVGVGLCAVDNPLVSLGEPGCWRYSREFWPDKPVVFVNLFNNQWTTNFRLWNSGTWTARVRLWAVSRASNEAALITPSLEARYPLQARWVWARSGALPAAQGGLGLSRKGVLVTAFGANPDGDGLVLRLWELAGQTGTCRVRLPAGLSNATIQPVDLRGSALGEPRSVTGREFEVLLLAFAPASFVIRTQSR